MNTVYLPKEVIKNAYENLDKEEREKIDLIAGDLRMGIKQYHRARWPGSKGVIFGETMALELLARIGVWMVENEIEVV